MFQSNFDNFVIANIKMDSLLLPLADLSYDIFSPLFQLCANKKLYYAEKNKNQLMVLTCSSGNTYTF